MWQMANNKKKVEMIVSEKLQATISDNKLISLGSNTAVSRYNERDILPTRCTRLRHVFSASCVIDTLCTRGRRISLILEVSPSTKDNTHTHKERSIIMVLSRMGL